MSLPQSSTNPAVITHIALVSDCQLMSREIVCSIYCIYVAKQHENVAISTDIHIHYKNPR